MRQTFKYWIYSQIVGSEVVYRLSDIQWGDWEGAKDRVLIAAFEFEHDMPEISESTPAMVAGLEAKRETMRATAAAAIAEVDAQIQSLLAIEHQEEVA